MEVSALTEQLQQAKEQLRETDESIKKVTGRDMFEPRVGGPFRDVPTVASSVRGNAARNPIYTRENAAFARDVERSRPAPGFEESSKRSRAMSSFHPVVEPTGARGDPSDRSDRRRGGWDDDDEYRRRKIQSLVIVDQAPKKTREERIVEASVRVGDKDVARNRRIFGSLMGTLKKFQQEQNHRAPTDERQSEIRKKLEEKEFAEKRDAQRARRDLFWDRKRKAAVVKFLETKVDIVKRFHDWETSQKPLLNFIRTEGPPPIYYMPVKLNKIQEEKLEASRKIVAAAIQTRKEYMESQLRRLDGKIDYMNRPKQQGDQEMSLEDDMKAMKKEMLAEEPLDDIDVEALLDDNEVEGLELVAIEDHAMGGESIPEVHNNAAESMEVEGGKNAEAPALAAADGDTEMTS